MAVTSVTFKGVCFLALHTSKPEHTGLLTALGKLAGPHLASRRKAWWFPPSRAGIAPPLYPDYHSGILRGLDEAAGGTIHLPEGGIRPY